MVLYVLEKMTMIMNRLTLMTLKQKIVKKYNF